MIQKGVPYGYINIKILYGNVTNIQLVISKGKSGAIDAKDTLYDVYYIIKYSSTPYTLQDNLNIGGQVIFCGEIVYLGTYHLPININSHYYVASNQEK